MSKIKIKLNSGYQCYTVVQNTMVIESNKSDLSRRKIHVRTNSTRKLHEQTSKTFQS